MQATSAATQARLLSANRASAPARTERKEPAAILVGTAPAGDPGPASTGAILQAALEKAGAQGKHPKHFLFFSPTATSQAAADAFLARLDERTEDRDAPVSIATIGAQITALAQWEQGSSPVGLTNVDNPVLVVNGDDDTMLPTSSSLHLAQLLGGSPSPTRSPV